MNTIADVDQMLLQRRATRARKQRSAGHLDAPLSFGQQTIWRSEHGTPRAGVSNFVLLFGWCGPVDRMALDRAVSALHEGHPALRTTFTEVATSVRQRIQPSRPVTVPWRDLTGFADARERLCRLAEELGLRPYRLSAEPPVRWLGVRLGLDEHVLVCAMHHLVADAASVAVLRADLARLYDTAERGQAPVPPNPPGCSTDLGVAQEQRVRDGAVDADLAVWQARLRGVTDALPLPFDREPSASSSYRGNVLHAGLPGHVLESLAAVGRAEGTGLLAVVTSLYALLIGRRGGCDDVVVGTVFSARTRPEWDEVVGYLAQPLPLRLDVTARSLRELVRHGRDVVLEAVEHQEVPFERLWRDLAVPVQPGRPPLVQTMCLLDHGGGVPAGEWPTVTQLPARVAAVDLSVTVVPGAAAACFWEYRTELFDRATVLALHEDFAALLLAAATDPDRTLVVP